MAAAVAGERSDWPSAAVGRVAALVGVAGSSESASS